MTFQITDAQWRYLDYAVQKNRIVAGSGATFNRVVCDSMVKRGWLIFTGKTFRRYYYRVTDVGYAVHRQLQPQACKDGA